MTGAIATTSWRATALGTALTAAMTGAAWLWWRAALSDTYAAWSASGPVPVVDGMTVLVQLAAASGWTVLTLLVAMGTAAVLPVGVTPDRSVDLTRPSRARSIALRVAAALLAATLTGPTAAPASAALSHASVVPAERSGIEEPACPAETPDAAGGADTPGATGGAKTPEVASRAEIPMPGWLPAPPPAAPAAQVALVSRGTPEDPMVTVRRGDTLWSIAAEHLPGSPTVEQVAESWPRWHAANREVIGPDPHLILPGQQLRPPAPTPEELP